MLLLLSALTCDSGSSGDSGGKAANSAPVIDAIPDQTAYAGQNFYLNLASYVHDNNEPSSGLVYEITAGGGQSDGPVYSNIFSVPQTVPVEFSVTDAGGESASGSFNVEVLAGGAGPLEFPSGCVFVSDNGEDGVTSGSPVSPYRSISYALERAVINGNTAIVVACGMYNESFTLSEGIDLLGGYDPGFTRRDTDSLKAVIRADGLNHYAILASDITTQTIVEGFIIEGPNSSLSGETSSVIHVIDSSSALEIKSCVLYAGRGGDGAAGISGANGADGGDGGAGATSVCPSMNSRNGSGNNGLGANRGLGGAGGYNRYNSSGDCGSFITGGYSATGVIGADGGVGAPGSAGSGGSADGWSITGGVMVSDAGGSCQDGLRGSGGGGGGAGGGADSVSGCSAICYDTLGPSGGGGAGGSSGKAGMGGAGGVFGIFIHNSVAPPSVPLVTDCVIYCGMAGNGGNGGLGGVGGLGGSGGQGGIPSGSLAYAMGSAGSGGYDRPQRRSDGSRCKRRGCSGDLESDPAQQLRGFFIRRPGKE